MLGRKPTERRREPRHQETLELELWADGQRLSAQLVDLSWGGLKLMVAGLNQAPRTCSLLLPELAPDHPCGVVELRVAWSRPKGAGRMLGGGYIDGAPPTNSWAWSLLDAQTKNQAELDARLGRLL
ncbi:MAG: PilZ domain-containing protein [Candidatus Eremiobacteraeota bacterium]|nr:PilZ domain-containing protein [Candidatus Eremiobacteraeota bacterium]